MKKANDLSVAEIELKTHSVLENEMVFQVQLYFCVAFKTLNAKKNVKVHSSLDYLL